MKRLAGIILFVLAAQGCYGQDEGYYKNEKFSIEMKKVSGWELKESESVEPRTNMPMLSLAFGKGPGRNANFRNNCIITISKLPSRVDDNQKKLVAISSKTALDRATKNLENLVFIEEPRQITINDVPVHDVIFEWGGTEKYVSRLMLFGPANTEKNAISIMVLMKCPAEEYPDYESALQESLNSIKVMGATADNQ